MQGFPGSWSPGSVVGHLDGVLSVLGLSRPSTGALKGPVTYAMKEYRGFQAPVRCWIGLAWLPTTPAKLELLLCQLRPRAIGSKLPPLLHLDGEEGRQEGSWSPPSSAKGKALPSPSTPSQSSGGPAGPPSSTSCSRGLHVRLRSSGCSSLVSPLKGRPRELCLSSLASLARSRRQPAASCGL